MHLCDILKKDLHSSTSLAGSTWGEVILVRLREGGAIFGIGAFKIKEAIPWRRALPSASGFEGAAMDIDVRGARIPLFDLGGLQGASCAALKKGVALLTESDGQLKAFGVHAIDGVIRVDWSSAQESGKGGQLFAMEALSERGERIVVLGLERQGKPVAQALATPESQEAAIVFSVGISPATQRAIEDGARALGLNVRRAESSGAGLSAWQEALGHLESATIAAIVVEAEAQDGDADGYSVARQIKADERWRHIPVIMSASASAAPSQALGRQVGANGFIQHASAELAQAALGDVCNL